MSADAPGRVNRLGEHTDYNEGYVLPAAIPQRTRVQVKLIAGPMSRVHAAALGRSAEFSLSSPPKEAFALYVYGCAKELERRGVRVPPVEMTVDSDVPMGVGLSSSAALEVATLRALQALLGLELDAVSIAQLAQQAEVRYAGVNCGIMDQMAASLAEPGRALFLDTRTLERRLVPLPEGAQLLVLDSGVSRSLAHSGYNERRSQCEQAARLLGVPALRDIEDPLAGADLPPPLGGRVRHVVSENRRVLRAAAQVGAAEFGELMRASHASLREDFRVSTPELDELVACLDGDAAVFGARMTGAGFGGACVALCRAGEGPRAGQRALQRYRGRGRVLVA